MEPIVGILFVMKSCQRSSECGCRQVWVPYPWKSLQWWVCLPHGRRHPQIPGTAYLLAVGLFLVAILEGLQDWLPEESWCSCRIPPNPATSRYRTLPFLTFFRTCFSSFGQLPIKVWIIFYVTECYITYNIPYLHKIVKDFVTW